jgi:hypothetical protein
MLNIKKLNVVTFTATYHKKLKKLVFILFSAWLDKNQINWSRCSRLYHLTGQFLAEFGDIHS